MPFAEHTAPIMPGEDILEHPKSDDPRVALWIDALVNIGVLDREGNAMKPLKIRRGIGPKGYLWRAEWED